MTWKSEVTLRRKITSEFRKKKKNKNLSSGKLKTCEIRTLRHSRRKQYLQHAGFLSLIFYHRPKWLSTADPVTYRCNDNTLILAIKDIISMNNQVWNIFRTTRDAVTVFNHAEWPSAVLNKVRTQIKAEVT